MGGLSAVTAPIPFDPESPNTDVVAAPVSGLLGAMTPQKEAPSGLSFPQTPPKDFSDPVDVPL